MSISSSKSGAIVLDQKMMACPIQIDVEFTSQVEEFKSLAIMFMNEGRMEDEINRLMDAASAVMRTLQQQVVVKREIIEKAKLLTRLVNVSTLTLGYKICIMIERTRFQIQAGENSFLCSVSTFLEIGWEAWPTRTGSEFMYFSSTSRLIN